MRRRSRPKEMVRETLTYFERIDFGWAVSRGKRNDGSLTPRAFRAARFATCPPACRFSKREIHQQVRNVRRSLVRRGLDWVVSPNEGDNALCRCPIRLYPLWRRMRARNYVDVLFLSHFL